jgi:hypothetical protein
VDALPLPPQPTLAKAIINNATMTNGSFGTRSEEHLSLKAFPLFCLTARKWDSARRSSASRLAHYQTYQQG